MLTDRYFAEPSLALRDRTQWEPLELAKLAYSTSESPATCLAQLPRVSSELCSAHWIFRMGGGFQFWGARGKLKT